MTTNDDAADADDDKEIGNDLTTNADNDNTMGKMLDLTVFSR